MTTCPFCGHDPYHYVHNGLGMEAVAINCCEAGVALFGREKPETVTFDYDEFSEIATKLFDLRHERAEAERLAIELEDADALIAKYIFSKGGPIAWPEGSTTEHAIRAFEQRQDMRESEAAAEKAANPPNMEGSTL